MATSNQDMDLFPRLWQAEISKAIEIFTGEKVEAGCRRGEQALGADDGPAYLWWKQEFEADEPLTVWIGAPEAAWAALGGGGEPDERCKQIYFDILRHAHDAVANVLGGQTGKRVRCLRGEAKMPGGLASLDICRVEISLRGQALPAFLIGMETTAEANPRKAADECGLPKALPATSSAVLGRLMELELPLAVSLGKAVLPIREILKITPGSLIELDRTPADHVDLLVHGKVVARGEIVSVKGNYGVRIQEIISREDRMELQGNA